MPPKRKISSSSPSLASRGKRKIIKEYSNSITSLNSLSEKDERIRSDIRKFRQPTEQRELAKKLKDCYLDNNPNETWYEINDKDNIDDDEYVIQMEFFKKLNSDFNPKKDYHKQLLFPSTLLQFMSLINNLELTHIDSDIYDACQSDILSYFLTIIDTINIKVLYVICDGDNYYLSPLNLKKIRTQLRKQKINIDSADININNLNEELKTQYKEFKDKRLYKIDESKYDFVFISSSFKKFNTTRNKLQVVLSNIDLTKDYKSSILFNENHVISINKCNNYNILNTTWYPFNNYNITDFKDYDFYIKNEKIYYIEDTDIDDNKEKNYYLRHKIKDNFENSLLTINLYSNRASLKTKIYKQIEGGTIELKENIPEVSVCSDVFFPNNLYEFCWFSSIINSLFYTDDIAAIFLNKSIRNMDNTFKFFNDFYIDKKYQTINFKDQKELKKILKHVIYIMSFIYCSYSILSKNQLDERITNKKKWYEIYKTFTDKDTYRTIATIILGLSNIKK